VKKTRTGPEPERNPFTRTKMRGVGTGGQPPKGKGTGGGMRGRPQEPFQKGIETGGPTSGKKGFCPRNWKPEEKKEQPPSRFKKSPPAEWGRENDRKTKTP